MSNEILININSGETRVALLENGLLVELYVERNSEQGISGNIYKGRVVRVLPGMQAAFVDIGLEKAAFLYVTDVHKDFDDLELLMRTREEEGNGGPPREEEEILSLDTPFQIEDLLHEGQELLVQVSKEPLGTKGARITSHISLPGRHLVLMPMVDHVGVSRRIENEAERRRLREIIQHLKSPGCGLIVRTVSEGKGEGELRQDLDFLLKMWGNIQRRKANSTAPSLVHKDLDITLRAVRDLLTEDVERVVVDSEEEYRKILEFCETFMPRLKSFIELYDKEEPLFDFYSIEMEISRALGRRVWLKSGGYIVIDQTEALTVIDVNTGRYVGKRNLEDTILKTNLEAVKEIAYQLRLRNIGGIIIIDFIDMEKESSREKVFQALTEALKKDKSKTNILKISELGLVEMTRKRTRESLGRILNERCFYCEGRGFLKSRSTICQEILREIQRDIRDLRGESILVEVHPNVANLLYDEARGEVEKLEKRFGKRIVVSGKSDYHLEQYEIRSANSQISVDKKELEII
ncbi:MAG: Rne/Rng family ribonuclease [Deltaproteobacteria bacterium]|nr:Rne/Rng family ribonuclease [Deltaproteobacteria bacterium]